MRAITVRQPWATAIVRMGKDVENRTRNIAGAYRGPVAIHAGAALPPGRRGTRTEFPGVGEVERDLSGLLLRSDYLAWPYRLPMGALIGVVDLVDVCVSTWQQMDAEQMACCLSRWAESPGEDGVVHHLHLRDPRPLVRPLIPYRGALGLWTLPDDVLAGAL